MSIVSASQLAERLTDPSLRIADVRWYLARPGGGRRAYELGHIPGAVFVDLDRDLAATPGPGRHPLPDPLAFARRLGALGIGSSHSVVCYDDVGGSVAARLWWMLDALGHGAVAVLDGGIGAWRAGGHALSTVEPSYPAAELELGASWARTIDRDELRGRLGQVTLLDARAGERYRGEVEPIDPAAGHIPTARNLPTASLLTPDGRFLPGADLEARFRDVGGGAQTVVSCGSGVTACHTALAMRLAGLPDPVLYAGSFSDWSRSGESIATGAEPGAPAPT